jgi:hypothetical protein
MMYVDLDNSQSGLDLDLSALHTWRSLRTVILPVLPVAEDSDFTSRGFFQVPSSQLPDLASLVLLVSSSEAV